MNACFSDAALQWGGLAAHVLHWRPAEFWAATPAELAMALAPPDSAFALPFTPPDRETIARLMERDAHD